MSERKRDDDAIGEAAAMDRYDDPRMQAWQPSYQPYSHIADPVLRQMLMGNEILNTSPRTYGAYMQGVSMPLDPRIRGYRQSPAPTPRKQSGMVPTPGEFDMAANKPPSPSPYPKPGTPWPTPRGAPGPLLPPLPWQPPDWT